MFAPSLAAFAAVLMIPSLALAGTLFVSNEGDDANDCLSVTTPCGTIQAAVDKARDADVVEVAAGVYVECVIVDKPLELRGSHQDTFIVCPREGPLYAGLAVAADPVFVSDLVIARARLGILNRGGLELERVVLLANKAGGGIQNHGRLIVTDCAFVENLGNNEYRPAGGAGGGIYNESGDVIVRGSTFLRNAAQGIDSAEGGGIFNLTGTVTIVNSTFRGNLAGFGGALGSCGGAIANDDGGSVSLSNCTVHRNRSLIGGPSELCGLISIQNSIVSSLTGGCDEDLFSLGHNLLVGCATLHPTDVAASDPRLGEVGDYGGPTLTVDLLAGSAAIDAGDPLGCADPEGGVLAVDQRGASRPGDCGVGRCDIGAVEACGSSAAPRVHFYSAKDLLGRPTPYTSIIAATSSPTSFWPPHSYVLFPEFPEQYYEVDVGPGYPERIFIVKGRKLPTGSPFGLMFTSEVRLHF